MTSAPTLAKLVAFAEEGPWCATVFRPRPPGRVDRVAGFAPADDAGLNPQPLPPHPEAAALLWQAIALYQHAQALHGMAGAGAASSANAGTGTAAERLFQAAAGLYDEWGEWFYPRLQWRLVLRVLNFPPPPRPNWLERVGHAVSQAEIGARMGGDAGARLQAAASAVILERLGARALS